MDCTKDWCRRELQADKAWIDLTFRKMINTKVMLGCCQICQCRDTSAVSGIIQHTPVLNTHIHTNHYTNTHASSITETHTLSIITHIFSWYTDIHYYTPRHTHTHTQTRSQSLLHKVLNSPSHNDTHLYTSPHSLRYYTSNTHYQCYTSKRSHYNTIIPNLTITKQHTISLSHKRTNTHQHKRKTTHYFTNTHKNSPSHKHIYIHYCTNTHAILLSQNTQTDYYTNSLSNKHTLTITQTYTDTLSLLLPHFVQFLYGVIIIWFWQINV